MAHDPDLDYVILRRAPLRSMSYSSRRQEAKCDAMQERAARSV